MIDRTRNVLAAHSISFSFSILINEISNLISRFFKRACRLLTHACSSKLQRALAVANPQIFELEASELPTHAAASATCPLNDARVLASLLASSSSSCVPLVHGVACTKNSSLTFSTSYNHYYYNTTLTTWSSVLVPYLLT